MRVAMRVSLVLTTRSDYITNWDLLQLVRDVAPALRFHHPLESASGTRDWSSRRPARLATLLSPATGPADAEHLNHTSVDCPVPGVDSTNKPTSRVVFVKGGLCLWLTCGVGSIQWQCRLSELITVRNRHLQSSFSQSNTQWAVSIDLSYPSFLKYSHYPSCCCPLHVLFQVSIQRIGYCARVVHCSHPDPPSHHRRLSP